MISRKKVRDAVLALSYIPLWKLLVERKIAKKTLIEQAGISRSTLSKMSRDEPVNLGIIEKICEALNCKLEDVVQYFPKNPKV